MITIFKYPVKMSGRFLLEMPQGAQFLSLQVQGDHAQLWFRVDTSRPMRSYEFGVFGTGHEMTGDLAYAPHLGTFQLAEGSLVFHAFGGNYCYKSE